MWIRIYRNHHGCVEISVIGFNLRFEGRRTSAITASICKYGASNCWYAGQMHSRLLCALLLVTTLGRAAESPAGRWDGTIAFGTLNVPFTIVFEGTGPTITGSFVNGSSRVTSTSGDFESGRLTLAFGQFGTQLSATLADGGLKGTYGSPKEGLHAWTAFPYCTCSDEGEAGPDITGTWDVPERGWRLTLRREGEDTLATLIDGKETLGPLKGRFDGLTFTLHYFDGTRAVLADIDVRKDGALDVVRREPGREPVKLKATRAKPI